MDELGSFICGFPVYATVAGKFKTLEIPGGRTIQIFPATFLTFENGVTGRSVAVTLTGTFHFNPLPDGNIELAFVGRNTVYYDNPPGVLHFSLIIGPTQSSSGRAGYCRLIRNC